jgi:hypothetical protein
MEESLSFSHHNFSLCLKRKVTAVTQRGRGEEKREVVQVN